MMSLALRRWLRALVVCAVLVVICVLFIDRPVASFMHAHFAMTHSFSVALDLPLLFVPLSAIVILGCGLEALAGRTVSRWATATMLAGLSLMWALASNFFLLQPGFGRVSIANYVEGQGSSGFRPFHGHSGTGFPSGHTTIVASFLLVFWILYPRTRFPVAIVIGAVMAGLVMTCSHYVSDVIGGLFLGLTTAEMTIAIFGSARASQP